MSNYRSNDLESLAETLKAAANANRLRILARLADCCPPGSSCSTLEQMGACVGDIGERLEIAPSTVSHHIKELARAGLIRTTRDGRSIHCCVDVMKLGELAEFFAGLAGRESGDGK